MLNPLDAYHHGNKQRSCIGWIVVELFISDLCLKLKDGKPPHPASEHARRVMREAWNSFHKLITAHLNPGLLSPCHPMVTWTMALRTNWNVLKEFKPTVVSA